MSHRHLNTCSIHIGAIAALVLTALSTQAFADGAVVKDAWFRALPAGLPAGGYFTLHNGSAKTVTLTGASSPACGMLMLHKSESMGGMSHMDDVAQIDVAPGASVRFAPGSYHLMCMDPKPTLKVGASVPVTLSFADGGKLDVRFAVRNAAGN